MKELIKETLKTIDIDKKKNFSTITDISYYKKWWDYCMLPILSRFTEVLKTREKTSIKMNSIKQPRELLNCPCELIERY